MKSKLYAKKIILEYLKNPQILFSDIQNDILKKEEDLCKIYRITFDEEFSIKEINRMKERLYYEYERVFNGNKKLPLKPKKNKQEELF